MRKTFGKTVKVARPTKKVAKASKESPYKLEEPEKVFWKKLGNKVTVKTPIKKASIKKINTKVSGPKGKAKVEKVMHEFKEGELMMGKGGGKVSNKRQALAIALSEARRAVAGKRKRK